MTAAVLHPGALGCAMLLFAVVLVIAPACGATSASVPAVAESGDTTCVVVRAQGAVIAAIQDPDVIKPDLLWADAPARPASFSAWWIDQQRSTIGRALVADGHAQVSLLSVARRTDLPKGRLASIESRLPALEWLAAWQAIAAIAGASERPRPAADPLGATHHWSSFSSHGPSGLLHIDGIRPFVYGKSVGGDIIDGVKYAGWRSHAARAVYLLWSQQTRDLLPALSQSATCPDAAAWGDFARVRLRGWQAAPESLITTQGRMIPETFLAVLGELGTAEDLPLIQAVLNAIPADLDPSIRNDLIDAVECTRQACAVRPASSQR